MSKITLSFMQRFMGELDTAIKTYVGGKVSTLSSQLFINKGDSIVENTNLNDMQTIGVYYIPTDTVASSLTNLPLELCGKILISDNGNNGLSQIYIANHSPRIFTRTLFDNVWSSWVELFPQCTENTDGTYVLTATVSSGTVTYSWESNS